MSVAAPKKPRKPATAELAPPAAAVPLPVPPAQLGPQILIPGVEPEPEPERATKRYAFPTAARCPRCRSSDTVRTSQREETQYRQCRVVICRKRFAVTGKAI